MFYVCVLSCMLSEAFGCVKVHGTECTVECVATTRRAALADCTSFQRPPALTRALTGDMKLLITQPLTAQPQGAVCVCV